MPEIGVELQRMIAPRVGPVGDPLELVFLLIQRTVALVDGKRITKRKAPDAAQREGGHSRRVVIVQVQSGDAGILGGRSAQAVWIHQHAIAEESKAKVAQPVRPNNV